MKTRIGTSLVALVVIFVVAVLTLVIFTNPGSISRPPLPNPNGYDDFVKASEALGEGVGDFQTLDRAGLDALVSSNAESLRLVRLGLTRECAMPIDFALTNDVGMIGQLGGMKRLAQLLTAEGRLREMQNRAADAAGSYTDAIRLGNEISRGGFLITRLVGVACESIGCSALAKIVPELGPREARAAVTELEKVDADRVTWAEVQRNEKRFTRYHLNPLNLIPWLMAWRQTRQMMERAETKHNIVIAHERLLAGEMAMRCYQFEKAGLPVRLNDLVTKYLSTVPEDPFTGHPMVYHPEGTNWLLYSVGPDGVDDGGRVAGKGWPIKGDILFDSPW